MKRLLDEDDPSDEVVRLLIRAGANHSPPRSSKLRMIAALGLGSAIGLSASEVLAWLGTSSGKVALAVTVLGAAAGGTYLATAPASPGKNLPVSSASVSSATVPAAPGAAAAVVPPPREAATVASPAPPAMARESSASPDAEQRGKRPPAREQPKRSAAMPPPATPAGARALEAAPGAGPAGAAASVELERGHGELADETTWVDRLRVAADRRDEPAFERLQSEYAQHFPKGQLRPEVDRLRALLR